MTRASFASGFGSPAALYREGARALGVTPGAYRRGGQALAINYGVVDSSLGRLLVAATERGVCAIFLGDVDATLERQLAEEFPAARLTRDDGVVGAWASAVVDRVDRADERAAVPLDLQGTAFQLRVWRALQDIPLGATRSYGQLAAEIGRPSAVRAVARACATNHVSVVVPCHRVIGARGDVGGYRWGVDRKRKLLATEREGRVGPSRGNARRES